MSEDSHDEVMVKCENCGCETPVTDGGVWVAYCSDRSGIYPFATEIEALRYANGYCMAVKFVAFGKEVLYRD